MSPSGAGRDASQHSQRQETERSNAAVGEAGPPPDRGSDVPDRFTGTWELIPELSLYDEGEPPEQATYEIRRSAGDRVDVRVTWRPAGTAEPSTAEYSGSIGGEVTAWPGAPGLTALSLLRVDDRTLDSTAWNGDTPVLRARRVASCDGSLLVVLQTAAAGPGTTARTYQVYERREPPR